MIHSFLMIGQSNMAGRGFINEVAPIENPRVFGLRNGRFLPMFVPVNPDRSFSGISLGESFADAYSRELDADAGLIPCADGGTTLEQWSEGSLLFDHACAMAGLAARTSQLKAILWHQGESDCSEELYPTYAQRLIEMLTALRRRLGHGDIPILLGGLGDFLAECPGYPECRNYHHINDALKQVASRLNACAFVSAEGLGSNPDRLHFSAAALREFGRRYYCEYRKLAPETVAAAHSSASENGNGLSAMEKL